MEKVPENLVERWAGKEIEVACILKQVEDEYEKFDMKCVKQPQIKVDQAFKYLIHLLHQQIKAIETVDERLRNDAKLFFLFECRDVLAYILYIESHPDILEDDLPADDLREDDITVEEKEKETL